MPVNNERSSGGISSYSPEFQLYVRKQFELLHLRLEQFGENMISGCGTEWTVGFDQLSQQISGVQRKMEVAITVQRELRDELRELSAAQDRKAQSLGNE